MEICIGCAFPERDPSECYNRQPPNRDVWKRMSKQFDIANSDDYNPKIRSDYTKGQWHRTRYFEGNRIVSDRIVRWVEYKDQPYYLATTKTDDNNSFPKYETTLFDLGGNFLARSVDFYGCEKFYGPSSDYIEALKHLAFPAKMSDDDNPALLFARYGIFYF